MYLWGGFERGGRGGLGRISLRKTDGETEPRLALPHSP